MRERTFDKAKKNKADEFYTQWVDIHNEVNAYLDFDPDVFRGKTVLCPCDDPYESNFFKFFAMQFNSFGLKKLMATCYAGSPIASTQLTLFDYETEEDKTTKVPHKIEITEVADFNNDTAVDMLDVEWLMANKKNVLSRLEGDGDFRSDEVNKLRDEADIIVTNPPFSLFRQFLAWIMEAEKKFLIIGNVNAITYKEVFPLIKDNKIWMGLAFGRDFQGFIVPDNYPLSGSEARIDKFGNRIVSTNNTIWLTNLVHGRRLRPLELMTMADNLRHGRHKEMRGKESYDKYDNYDAIEVPYTEMIPSDYDGNMGVPISFLHKYCPEQFEILGATESEGKGFSNGLWKGETAQAMVNGSRVYKRLFVRHKGAK